MRGHDKVADEFRQKQDAEILESAGVSHSKGETKPAGSGSIGYVVIDGERIATLDSFGVHAADSPEMQEFAERVRRAPAIEIHGKLDPAFDGDGMAGAMDALKKVSQEAAKHNLCEVCGERPIYKTTWSVKRGSFGICNRCCQTPAVRNPRKVNAGRNEPCPCGSGKKFKHCHLRDVSGK